MMRQSIQATEAAARLEDDSPAARLDPVHRRQRLAIEADDSTLIGRGRTWLHPENDRSLAAALTAGLRLSGLLARGRRNARRIQVTRHEAIIPALPRALDGVRLLQIADPHLDMDEAFPNLLAETVSGVTCELCVLTGDYRYRTSGPIEGALRGLETLAQALPAEAFATLGNHDSVHMIEPMESMGYRLLMNEATTPPALDGALRLIGIDDPHYFRTDNLQRACSELPESAASVLLAHSPEPYRQAAACGIDLMLSGHTHGGQIRLPGGIAAYTNADCHRRYAAGAWRYGQMRGYTSNGAGCSIVDVRFNCPAEVVLHVLRRG